MLFLNSDHMITSSPPLALSLTLPSFLIALHSKSKNKFVCIQSCTLMHTHIHTCACVSCECLHLSVFSEICGTFSMDLPSSNCHTALSISFSILSTCIIHLVMSYLSKIKDVFFSSLCVKLKPEFQCFFPL